MTKTPVQFRHNGRDVALFVDGGTNLLVALRELIGDMTPKFGCGQGGCGACSVLIDGELHLSCLTLAETVNGRSIETLDVLKDGPNLHPLQRAFMEQFAAQCGYCTPGMLPPRVSRRPPPRARLRRIDTMEAERSPGVRRIIRGADVPVNLNTLLSLINFGKDDEPSLAVDKVRYKGEPIVAVVADSPREAYEALAKVRVDYEPLPAVFDVEEALKSGAPVVNETYPKNTFIYHDVYDHQKLRFGDVERGLAEADHVLEQRYQMSPIEHAPTETNGSIAAPDTNGRYVVYTSTQALFFSLDTCAKILDVPSNTFHFIGGTVGGGFGGKVDTLTEPLAILGAMLTGRPVRYQLGREEEMQFGSPRGAERIYIKDGVMRDGRIVARKIRAYFDSGAYTRLSSYAVVKCAAHLPGPYTIPNVHGDIYCVFTNRTPATAMP